MSVMRTKAVGRSVADTEEPEFRLRESLSALDLTVFGVVIFTLTARYYNPAEPPVTFFVAVW